MIPVRFFSIRVKWSYTVIASRIKSAGGIRTRDRKFQAFNGVERSNHYTIETRHIKRWYATCE